MSIFTNSFKKKAENILGEKIHQVHISKSNNMVTDEQVKEVFLDVLKRVKNGEGIVLSQWPDNTPKKSLSEIIRGLE